MTTKFRIYQALNIISLIALTVYCIIHETLDLFAGRICLLLSFLGTATSLYILVSLSVRYTSQIPATFRTCSSKLSPLYRYAFINLPIAAACSLIGVGLLYHWQLLPAYLLFSMLLTFATWLISQSGYLVQQDNKIIIFDYAFNRVVIHPIQLRSIKNILCGTLYQINYADSHAKTKTAYFFPSRRTFFREPSIVSEIKAMMTP